MSNVFIYEFLFRGGPTSKPDDDTFHVVLARETVDIEGKPGLEVSPVMTPARAEVQGFTLDRIITDINQAAVSKVALLEDRVTDSESRREETLRQLKSAEREINRLTAALTAATADKTADGQVDTDDHAG